MKRRIKDGHMKIIFMRFIAILLLVIPGIAAAYGFLEMKNSIFDYVADVGQLQSAASFQWLRFIFGFILFIVGAGFIGGWIFFRDRKRNYVAPRFKAKRKR